MLYYNYKFSKYNSILFQGTTMPCGVGGFFPYGFQGVVAGAATCFYAFIGLLQNLHLVAFI